MLVEPDHRRPAGTAYRGDRPRRRDHRALPQLRRAVRGTRARRSLSSFFAFVMGSGVSAQWRSWILFRTRRTSAIKDPQFHKDIGVLRLPAARSCSSSCGWIVRGAARGPDRHRGVPLPQRRHPPAEPVPAGHAAGEGAPLGDPRVDGAHEDRAVLPRAVRAGVLEPRHRRRRDLHRRAGAAARRSTC